MTSSTMFGRFLAAALRFQTETPSHGHACIHPRCESGMQPTSTPKCLCVNAVQSGHEDLGDVYQGSGPRGSSKSLYMMEGALQRPEQHENGMQKNAAWRQMCISLKLLLCGLSGGIWDNLCSRVRMTPREVHHCLIARQFQALDMMHHWLFLANGFCPYKFCKAARRDCCISCPMPATYSKYSCHCMQACSCWPA